MISRIFVKFIDKKTTIATEFEKDNLLTLPSIGICPGFKSDAVQDFMARGIDPWPLPTIFDSLGSVKGMELMEVSAAYEF